MAFLLPFLFRYYTTPSFPTTKPRKRESRDLEKLCEKTARQIYSVSEPHRPPHSNAVKSYVGSWTDSVCLLAVQSTNHPRPPCRCKREMEEDRSHEEHASLLRDVGDQPLAEGGFLDLTWCVAHIDDQTVDREHPDQGILVNHRWNRPIRIHRIHA
jgi:hypothetical protein